MIVTSLAISNTRAAINTHKINEGKRKVHLSNGHMPKGVVPFLRIEYRRAAYRGARSLELHSC